MSASIVNRVYLPDGTKLYISDDRAGDERLEQLFKQYGDLKLEACDKEFGKGLDELKAFWTGTIKEFLYE